MDFDEYKALFLKYFCISQKELNKLQNKGKDEIVELIRTIRETFIEILEYEVELDLNACKEEFFRVSHPE